MVLWWILTYSDQFFSKCKSKIYFLTVTWKYVYNPFIFLNGEHILVIGNFLWISEFLSNVVLFSNLCFYNGFSINKYFQICDISYSEVGVATHNQRHLSTFFKYLNNWSACDFAPAPVVYRRIMWHFTFNEVANTVGITSTRRVNF